MAERAQQGGKAPVILDMLEQQIPPGVLPPGPELQDSRMAMVPTD